jgi:hypothetical protein
MLSNELQRSKKEVEIKKEEPNMEKEKEKEKEKENTRKPGHRICHNYASSDAAVGSPPNQFIEHLKQRILYYDEDMVSCKRLR